MLREVGIDATLVGLKNKRVALFTDKALSKMEHVHIVKRALQEANCDVVVYDQVAVEPTDVSFKDAVRFACETKPDGFVSVGGGSVMDTCKAANLYYSYPVDDFLDYVCVKIH